MTLAWRTWQSDGSPLSRSSLQRIILGGFEPPVSQSRMAAKDAAQHLLYLGPQRPKDLGYGGLPGPNKAA
jgi:hypothetical protein